MPYAEVTIGAVMLLLLAATIYAFWKIGKKSSEARAVAAEAALAADRKVADAVDKARRRPVTADELGLRDQGSKPPPR